MMTSLVWILAGITAWCVASLALALVVGPLVRRGDRAAASVASSDRVLHLTQPSTGAIPLPVRLSA